MPQLEKLETTLDDVLNKKAPVKIPENGRKSLAGALWWLALIFGVLSLWGAWALWRVGHWVDTWVDYANSMTSVYGVSNELGVMYYLALVVLVVSAVMALLAAPGLKAMKKSGWNLLFYSMLVNAVYGVVVLFANYGGFGDMLVAFLGSLVGAYLLFQVRSQFMKSHQAAGHKA